MERLLGIRVWIRGCLHRGGGGVVGSPRVINSKKGSEKILGIAEL